LLGFPIVTVSKTQQTDQSGAPMPRICRYLHVGDRRKLHARDLVRPLKDQAYLLGFPIKTVDSTRNELANQRFPILERGWVGYALFLLLSRGLRLGVVKARVGFWLSVSSNPLPHPYYDPGAA
jgi:hypothetical protein